MLHLKSPVIIAGLHVVHTVETLANETQLMGRNKWICTSALKD